ncbi:polycomb protein suz12 isoform X2 [Cimex lectularius]|uniref:Polycomb protein VEFS-Box domain-containing protein n=1 Tax=Cimex lectularius TaxID=79782 RepID=A0A8I6SCD1_CIMLE|nr:polycomb protein suz12 isoform X2 [Cimex lectularius]
MPPKKRDKEADAAKGKHDGNADHEQFLQAFEKPTQIYRYLRTRNMLKPIFLWRTLTYMKHRMSRTNKNRKNFKVDSLLETVSSKVSQPTPVSGFLTLTFLGFYNKLNPVAQQEPVKVESLLLKVCHKKRKEVSCPVMKVSLGTSYVPFNPSETSPPPKAPTVSIPTDSFTLTGHLVKSYHLLLRVTLSANNIITANSDSDAEPAQKKRKYSKVSDDDKVVSFGTDLVIYDRQNRCLLTDGDYEFYLEEMPVNSSTRFSSLSTWEDIGSDRDKLNTGPTLKFRLYWSREPVTEMVDRPQPLVPLDMNDNSAKEIVRNDETSMLGKPTEEHSLVYQFLYNSNSKQQTETSPDMRCIWCSIDCKTIASLLRHLKLCHPRFSFSCGQMQGATRIDVTLNEGYDGSFWGPLGQMPRGNGPIRRTPLSHIIVCHPKRPNLNGMSEFMDMDENDFDTQRPYITGHNRLYHHTTTCLPIYPKEMGIDSEDENDPRWLQKKTIMMIDDFTDVNEGEKELMKMWNLHVMKHGSMFVGDCQVPLACTTFLQQKGKELLKKNLYRNFVLHMCSLFDFGLVSPVTLFMIMQKVQEIIQSDTEINQILQESWKTQKEHWNNVDQKPHPNSNNGISCNQTMSNIGDSGQRRKPTSDKKNTPKKTVVGEKRKHPDARRRLSLPTKPDQRRKVLKEAIPLRRRSSFNGEANLKKNGS